MDMSLQTNTPQKLHGNFTHRFLLAVTLRSRGELRVAEVCVELLRSRRVNVLGCESTRMAPRAGFEPAACRLTAESVKNLSAASGVACKNIGAFLPLAPFLMPGAKPRN